MWRIQQKRKYSLHSYSQDKTSTSTLWSHLVWERNCRTSWAWWPAGRRSSRLAPAAWSRSGFELPGREQNKQNNDVRRTSTVKSRGDRRHPAPAGFPHISDLLAGAFVRLQTQQDALRILEDRVHLVPHITLHVCRLCIWHTHTHTHTHTNTRTTVSSSTAAVNVKTHVRTDYSRLFTSRINLQLCFVSLADLTPHRFDFSWLFTVTWCEKASIK